MQDSTGSETDNPLLEQLRRGEVALGLCNMYPASGIIECMCRGWDFLWVDGQHGEMGYDGVLHAVQAASAVGIPALLRVPSHETACLSMFADLACSAVMAPMVNTVAQAERIVRELRFPPRGVRSYGGRRVIDLWGREYYHERELMVVTQVETPEALENAADIIALEGVDCLFFGPDDMKTRMGLPVNTRTTESPQLREAMELTVRAAKDAGKFAACVAPTPEALDMAAGMGYQMIVCGGDVHFLRIMASERLAQCREVLDSRRRTEPGARGTGGVY